MFNIFLRNLTTSPKWGRPYTAIQWEPIFVRFCIPCLAIYYFVTFADAAWGPNLCDVAAFNKAQVEEVGLDEFEQMLIEDVDLEEWDKTVDDLEWL